MIVNFRHKGLDLLCEKGDRRRLPSEYVDQVERMLARPDEATEPSNVDRPSFRLHPLKGDRAGYGVRVSGNGRIVFRFEGMNGCDVDLIDSH